MELDFIRIGREEFDPLAAELAKIPRERQPQVRRDAAIFVAGMEAAARVALGIQHAAQQALSG